VSGTKLCTICANPITSDFYRVNLQVACGKCAAAARAGRPVEGRAAFSQGMVFGIAGAAVGMVFYATLTVVTHFYIGYAAAAVGLLVGWAIRKGSNGVGGPRFQVAAALLTYLAISMSAIPVIIVQHSMASDFSLSSELGNLAVMGLASPLFELLNGFQGLIGLLVLVIAIRMAWKMTGARRLMVDGPHIVLG
jgi:hypothetical protein